MAKGPDTKKTRNYLLMFLEPKGSRHQTIQDLLSLFRFSEREVLPAVAAFHTKDGRRWFRGNCEFGLPEDCFVAIATNNGKWEGESHQRGGEGEVTGETGEVTGARGEMRGERVNTEERESIFIRCPKPSLTVNGYDIPTWDTISRVVIPFRTGQYVPFQPISESVVYSVGRADCEFKCLGDKCLQVCELQLLVCLCNDPPQLTC